MQNLGIEPTPQRRTRGPGLQRQRLSIPPDAPQIVRYRARMPFTLLSMRQQIMDDAKDRPKPKRERSLRRRLTPFDRALSEEQAEIIDRLIRGHLAIEAKLGCTRWQESIDGTKDSPLPIKDHERNILRTYAETKRHLNIKNRAILAELCCRMSPDCPALGPIDQAWISAAIEMANSAISINNNLRKKRLD